MFQSTKTYGHNIGLSCTFRQWKAESHCKYLHGYALQFKFIFQAVDLDLRNWVVDFGSLKSLKAMLENTFDHKHVVAADDPLLEHFKETERLGGSQVRVLPAVGCEAFAYYAAQAAHVWLIDNGYAATPEGGEPRVKLHSVEVSEHGANSAIFVSDDYHNLLYPPFEPAE